MFLWYGYRCAACKKRRKLTVDHVQPLRYGGKDHVTNAQPLCGSCNSSKGARFKDYRDFLDHVKMMDWMRERGILLS